LASSGVQAVLAISNISNPPNVLIVDFNMPDVNGLQILRMIRCGEADVARDLRVLMLTGSSDFNLVGAAMALDVDAFLVKPVSKATLSSRLEKLVNPPGDIKSVQDYAKIDIDAISRTLQSRQPVGTPRPRTEQRGTPSGVKLGFDALVEGMYLGEDIYGPAGELLLPKNTRLSDRLIRRMKELRGILQIESMYVTKAEEAKKA
jgi:CheY-like chemotaxis protein